MTNSRPRRLRSAHALPAAGGSFLGGVGTLMGMTAYDESTDARDPAEPNVRPAQQDHGGHGGMTTREQEKRVHDENQKAGTVTDTKVSPVS